MFPVSPHLASGFLADVDIEYLCLDTDKPMITPFQQKLVDKNVISYGLSSVGYDATLAPTYKLFTNVNNSIVDPKNFTEDCFIERDGPSIIIPPNSFMLGHTIEVFDMPTDVAAICIGKSTYARCGIIVNVTPLEPGWRGQVTIEVHNTTPLPAIVYGNEGICQFLFLRTINLPRMSYDKRGGKYMDQEGIVLPKILPNVA